MSIDAATPIWIILLPLPTQITAPAHRKNCPCKRLYIGPVTDLVSPCSHLKVSIDNFASFFEKPISVYVIDETIIENAKSFVNPKTNVCLLVVHLLFSV